MTNQKLKNFLQVNSIEWHKHSDDVVAFIDFNELKEFTQLVSYPFSDDEGYQVTLKESYVAIWMKDILEYHDWKLEEVFTKDNYDD